MKTTLKTLVTILLILFTTISCKKTETKKNNNMKNSENKTTVAQYFEYFNAHNWEAKAAMYVAKPKMKDPAYGTKMMQMT